MKKTNKYNVINLGLIIKMRRNELGLTQQQLADSVNMGRVAFNAIENGYNVAPLDRIIALNRVLGINLIDNDLILKSENGISQHEYESITKEKHLTYDLGQEIYNRMNSQVEKNRTIDLPNGKSLIGIDLVESHTEGDFLNLFKNKKNTATLDKYFITADKDLKGEFLAVRVSGNGMANWTNESIPDKSIVVGSRIKANLWQHEYHMTQWKYFIVVLKSKVSVVEIVNTDIRNGIFELRYLNPDKDYYPNIKVNFEECYAVYNIVCKVQCF